jgi:hypothetical protein
MTTSMPLVQGINYNGGGNDHFQNDTDIPCTVYGGAGTARCAAGCRAIRRGTAMRGARAKRATLARRFFFAPVEAPRARLTHL